MQLSDPGWMVGEVTGKGDEDTFIDGDEDNHEEQRDDRDGGGGHLEGAEVRVHPVALLD